MTELKAEIEICKLANKMQQRVDKIQSGENRTCATALINSIIKAAATLSINTPTNAKPWNWKAWVQEWNVFCYKHKKEIYTIKYRQ